MSNVQQILHCQNILGEGPLWSADQQCLYWVDIMGKCYWRFDPVSGQHESIDVGTFVGVLAERVSGGLIMATKNGIGFWDEQKRVLDIVAHPESNRPHMRFNDGAVDSAGRFWAGTMTMTREDGYGGILYRFDPDGSLHAMLEGVGTSNGIGWSPDNRIMYYTDTTRRIIYAFDFDATTGNIANQRVLVETPQHSGGPDGLAVDDEGFIWSAQWNGARLVRYAPDGSIERIIPVPALRPTCPVFGGPDRRTLYITSAAVEDPLHLEYYPMSGDLFALQTEVTGPPKYKFAG